MRNFTIEYSISKDSCSCREWHEAIVYAKNENDAKEIFKKSTLVDNFGIALERKPMIGEVY